MLDMRIEIGINYLASQVAGGGEPFHPSDVLSDIWNADDIVGNDGDSFSTWNPEKGSFDFSQLVGANQLSVHTGVLNGHRVARADGTEGMCLGAGELDNMYDGGGTFLMVLTSKKQASARIYEKTVNNLLQPGAGDNSLHTLEQRWTYTDGTVTWYPTSPFIGSSVGFKVVAIRYNTDTPDNNVLFDVDGSPVAMTEQNPRNGSRNSDAGGVFCLANRPSDYARGMLGDIAWIGYHPSELSDSDLNKVEAWLQERFAL